MPLTNEIKSLAIVKTLFYKKIQSRFVAMEQTDCSDSGDTINTPFADAFNFGGLAPSETSPAIIISFNVPNVQAITNIRLGLISAGGINFDDDIFGITTSPEIRSDIKPSKYFQGINVTRSATSNYNVSVANLDNYNSEYVYINIRLPEDNFLGEGVVRYVWFFDYV